MSQRLYAEQRGWQCLRLLAFWASWDTSIRGERQCKNGMENVVNRCVRKTPLKGVTCNGGGSCWGDSQGA